MNRSNKKIQNQQTRNAAKKFENTALKLQNLCKLPLSLLLFILRLCYQYELITFSESYSEKQYQKHKDVVKIIVKID